MMTKEEIIEMPEYLNAAYEGDDLYTGDQVRELMKLVEAKEREACAKLCYLAMLQNQEAINELEEDEHIAKCFIQGAMTQLVKTSKAIRERGQANG